MQGHVPRAMRMRANVDNYESDDEEDIMGRITATHKWGEFDDDCNVASSSTFNN